MKPCADLNRIPQTLPANRVPRLPNGTWVNHVTGFFFQGQIPTLRFRNRFISRVQGPDKFAAQLKRTLNVSVSQKLFSPAP